MEEVLNDQLPEKSDSEVYDIVESIVSRLSWEIDIVEDDEISVNFSQDE